MIPDCRRSTVAPEEHQTAMAERRNMPYGTVKWFDGRKGYGFITKEDGSGDVFAHFQEIVGEGYRTLNEGDRVKFEIANSPKGEKATNIEIA
jgi:CspA family cold shock protein